ncbi:hypothetical protein REPUB_Repub03eG0042400 [Reevesia pubescens]
MSTIYVLGPPTKGKVILNTTYGPICIELWPKEAPKAVRNFVQLCLECYFDDTVFHRIIKGFLVQGGDPPGSGTGGESIYGSVFSDEFHSRLRFNHRGIVACANAGLPHSNESQFFISLDKCEWLDRKNTIFGKVTGDSIFNLLRIGEVDTDQNDRPLVLWNPFEDIVPRVSSRHLVKPTAEAESKDSKKKPIKKLNLLSLGEEAEEEEKELEAVKLKIKSSHDVLDDPRFLKKEIPDKAQLPLLIQNLLMLLFLVLTRIFFGSVHTSSNDESSDDDQPRVEKLSLKKKSIGSEARAERMANTDADLQLFNEAERGRLLQKQKKRRLQGHEDEVLAKLEKFKQSISTKPAASSSEPRGGGDNEDFSDWKAVRLAFAPDTKDGMSRKDDPNDYEVDPLLEKGKEKFNRMQAKQKRRERE